MSENQSIVIQNSTPSESKKIKFLDQQSIKSSSTRKKYLLKKSKFSSQMETTNMTNKSNIFDLTSSINRAYSQINSSSHSISQSRLYTNSLFQSPSKDTLIDNPQKRAILPIITESKYNFKPTIAFPKIKFHQYPQEAPLYLKNAAKADQNNIRKLKKYKKKWAYSSLLRQDISLLDRSTEKAQKYIQKHNNDLLKRKASIQFQTILRDRHIHQQSSIGIMKGVPKKSLPGLKGKGGSVKSLFEEMYAIEQVYKIDK